MPRGHKIGVRAAVVKNEFRSARKIPPERRIAINFSKSSTISLISARGDFLVGYWQGETGNLRDPRAARFQDFPISRERLLAANRRKAFSASLE